MRKNALVAKILYEIAELLEIQNVPWKPQAYKKAAQTVEGLQEDIAVVAKEERLEELPGIGSHIALKIQEIVKTGRLKYLIQLRKKVPIKVHKLSELEGVGPKTIKLLNKKLGIKNIQDLKRAAKAGKLEDIKGLGKKSQQKILESISRHQKRGSKRFLYGRIAPLAEEIVQELKKVRGISKVELAGSFRRGKETIGDLDILMIAKDSKLAMDKFRNLSGVARVIASGKTKTSVELSNGLQVDARVVSKDQYGSALQYFTGSKEHSVRLRRLALKKGLSLSEYSLSKVKTKKVVASKTEQDIYKKLGLQYIPPEMREDNGEIELAAKNKIPKLVTLRDIKGDFQTQTKWSDGSHTIEQMASAAEDLGWKYLVITDHVGSIGIANPLDTKRLAKQAKEIDKLNKKTNVHILKGAEIDINKNGELAISAKQCKKLDVVLASIHSAFRQSKREMTKRILYAFENYPINIFGHPTGRKMNRRPGVDFSLEKVFQSSKDHNVFLEINGQPERLDLQDTHIHVARDMNCKFVVSSDTHSIQGFSFMKYAVKTARRGWLQKKHILNTKNLQQVQKAMS